MAKNRKLVVLYQLLLTEFITVAKDRNHLGICNRIYDLMCGSIITTDEETLLYNHFLEQKPSENELYKSFTENENWLGRSWWWKDNIVGYNQRILFLEAIINNLK